jgi:hypothetical protein
VNFVRTGLDKASTKRDNLLALQCDVRNSIGNREAVDVLSEVLVGNYVGGVARLASKSIRLDAKLLLQESLCGLLYSPRDTTLGERVVDAIDTIGLEYGFGVVGLELSLLRANRAHAVGSVTNGRVPKTIK